ncbi:hypothetical protein C1645_819843 [Glomus cerebriforme]|uniref:Uncharacterized protein n=1 Tax=Glomus cerebriforme TaxID=658196 RepID=A0A397T421_9GLOM|nr:hypothetical protein C1645_819843 [Glomus cerebriforme]
MNLHPSAISPYLLNEVSKVNWERIIGAYLNGIKQKVISTQHNIPTSTSISVLVHENDNNIEMEVYKGEYDNDIEVELEQDNIEQNFDNEKEEKDKKVLLLCVIIN